MIVSSNSNAPPRPEVKSLRAFWKIAEKCDITCKPLLLVRLYINIFVLHHSVTLLNGLQEAGGWAVVWYNIDQGEDLIPHQHN